MANEDTNTKAPRLSFADRQKADPNLKVDGQLEFGKESARVDYSVVNQPLPKAGKEAGDELELVFGLRKDLKRQADQLVARLDHFEKIDKELVNRRGHLIKLAQG